MDNLNGCEFLLFVFFVQELGELLRYQHWVALEKPTKNDENFGSLGLGLVCRLAPLQKKSKVVSNQY
jgi:hypothetical protein